MGWNRFKVSGGFEPKVTNKIYQMRHTVSFQAIAEPEVSSFITPSNQAVTDHNQTLRRAVTDSLNEYINRLEGHAPANVYDMVLEQIEVPLLKVIMRYVRGNQCKAAIILGISRGTLRKKLKQYGML